MKDSLTMRIDQLNGLLAFLIVAEKRGFAGAARALGVSPSALCQSVRALEVRVGTALLVRTTRAMALTEAGERLYRRTAAGLHEAVAALQEATNAEGTLIGSLRLSIPNIAFPFIEHALCELHEQHPQLVMEIVADDKFVDLVRDGYDAGIRLFEAIERDMVAIRLTPPFQFVVVGAPEYFKRRPKPRHPRDLLKHDCIGFRIPTTGELYIWEFERRGRELKVPVAGPFVSNTASAMVRAAELSFGLAYVPDFTVATAIETRKLERVLDEFAPRSPGLFLYFAQRAKDQPKVQALLSVLRARAKLCRS
jgi:DNA-binding transcriptional LysR family regulator